MPADKSTGLSPTELSRFVLWLTGSDSVPVPVPAGYFVVTRTADAQRLPVAHSCFRAVDCPLYPSVLVLKQKLMLAIDGSEGTFGG